MDGPLDAMVWFYNQRAGAENLIKQTNNDAGLAAHPSSRWMMNANWFQIAMPAYNLNCWLQLFSREENVTVDAMKHTTLATARLRFLFLAARTWHSAGRVGVRYSDHYQGKRTFHQLMDRLRKVASRTGSICSGPPRAAARLIRHRGSRRAFYAHFGQPFQAFTALLGKNGKRGKIQKPKLPAQCCSTRLATAVCSGYA